MPSIRVLSPHIANQIAAGEVVERPSSIVKELVENALDAHATAVEIDIQNGGIDSIVITDNGSGISDEDCETAFLRHATSKISNAEDLGHIGTLGFRGEALASIAAVSRVRLTTRRADEELGSLVVYEGGILKEHKRTGGTVGTRIEVTGLFYNVPARLKFLKSPRSESGAVGEYVLRMILSNPAVSVHFSNNGRTVYRSPGDGSLLNALASVYGVEIAAHLCPVTFDDGYLKIQGFVGTPELSRPNRTGQFFFLNGRIIRSNSLSAALARAFDTRLLIGRYPFAALNLNMALAEVDVNVHPAKLEVRFVDESRVARSICVACSEALIRSYVPDTTLSSGRDGNDASTASSVPTAANSQDDQGAVAFGVQGTTDAVGAAPAGGHIDIQEQGFVQSGGYSGVPAVDLRAPMDNQRHTLRESGTAWRDTSGGRGGFAPIRGNQSSLFYEAAQAGEGQRKNPSLSEPFYVVGVAFSTYWFVQRGEALYCIDQHAAHERLLYDKLQNREIAVVSQALLTPETMTLSPEDYALYLDKKQELLDFGYVFCDDEQENRVILAAVPQLDGVALRGEFLLDMLHERDITRQKLTQSACKHAIKAGEPITKEELAALLEALAQQDALLTCPHGRPVAVRMTKLDLEKMFKRIV